MQARLRTGLVATVVALVIASTAIGVAVAAGPGGPIVGGPAGAGACAASAATARAGGTVASLRAFGDCEISRRLTTLGQLSNAVGAARGLTAADALALEVKIGTASSGLIRLKAAMDAQAAPAAMRVEIVQIVTKYRVYELLLPQVRLTIAADSVLALKPHFDDISANLTARISNARAKGKDIGSAQTSLAAMNTAVGNAVSLASPLPAQLLALTPDQYAAGTAAVLQAMRTGLGHAAQDLKLAAQDGRNVIAAIK